MRSEDELRAKEDNLYIVLDEMGGDPVTRAKLDALQFIMGEGDCITDEELDPPKTNDDLDKLIEVLRREKEKLSEYSFFGDPNWKMIDAQIEIAEWAKGG